MKKYLFIAIAMVASIASAEPVENKNENILTIDLAIDRAIASNSAFLALSKQKEISKSLLKQAGQTPVTQLTFGVDDFAGSGPYKSTSSMKSSIGFSQSFETGHKRRKRIASAKASCELEGLKYEVAKKELKLKVLNAYSELFRLMNEYKIQEEATKLAQETAEIVNKKVYAGELAPIDATRVNVEFSREEALKQHLELDILSAKNELASLWNSKFFEYEDIDLICDAYFKQNLSQPTDEILNSSPEVKIADSQIKLARMDVRKAKAEANADVDLAITYNKFRENSEHAWAIEASFPLKGNSEAGNIRAVEQAFEVASLEKEGILSEFSVKLANTFREKESLQKELDNIENSLLPVAKQAYNETKIAFEHGEKSLLDLFDARKTMLETYRLYLEIKCKLFSAIGEYAVLSNQY